MNETLLIAALPGWKSVVACPTFWGLLAAVVGLYLLVPPHTKRKQLVGGGIGLIGLGLLIADQLRIHLPGETLAPHVIFWLLAAIAILGAVGTISAQNPIYCAIWFALSLLGVAAIFLQQDAQFLGIATVIVYAGAIVVTFLFVLMLAQPEGHSVADRISWGLAPKLCGVLVAGTLVGCVSHVLHPSLPTVEAGESTPVATPVGSVSDQLAAKFPELASRLVGVNLARSEDAVRVTLLLRGDGELGVAEKEILTTLEPIAPQATLAVQKVPNDVQAKAHMAHLGGYLFSRHLIAVELVGTLLLVALVGAVGMIIQGRLAKEGAAHE